MPGPIMRKGRKLTDEKAIAALPATGIGRLLDCSYFIRAVLVIPSVCFLPNRLRALWATPDVGNHCESGKALHVTHRRPTFLIITMVLAQREA
jgi:hypothetical protein